MKFPKLKNTVLCELILYFPAGSLFWYLIIMLLIHGWDNSFSAVEGIGLLAAGVFSLWYLLYQKNFQLLMMSSGLFSMIRSWKRDRLEYRTFCNGHSREEAEKRILRRCRLWGRRYKDLKASDNVQFQIFYRHSSSASALISCIEKRIAVCSVDHLTAENYSALITRAGRLLKQIPDGKIYFKTPSEKKAPRLYAYTVVILADRVDAEVRSMARKTRIAKDTEYLLPCVSESSSGTYYLDGGREYYLTGLMARPAKNFALSLLHKLVFAGRWPLKDKTQRPNSALNNDLDISLWEYIRKFNNEFAENKTELEKERKKFLRSLSDGEMQVGEYAIYYQMGKRLVECAYLLDEEDEKLISFKVEEFCHIREKEFPYKVSKRKMKKEQIIAAADQIEKLLIADGYRIEEED